MIPANSMSEAPLEKKPAAVESSYAPRQEEALRIGREPRLGFHPRVPVVSLVVHGERYLHRRGQWVITTH